MCGFITILDLQKKIDFEKAKQSQYSINHRGPDNTSFWITNDSLYLGHNRLSIIDLSDNANQPFFTEDRSFAIVFNGEIYNYKDLKKQLNYQFKSKSDTEVVLAGYILEGESFFKKLRGIYAFVIIKFFNDNRYTIIAARDPSGVKPLYYYFDGNTILLGSEIKSIVVYCRSRLSINYNSLYTYLNTSYCPEPQTAFKEIHALSPGCYLTFENKKIDIKYFFFNRIDQSNNYSFNENIEFVQNKLNIAVKRNLVSDIGCSIALSGGIDSSLIYYYAHKINIDINAITVGFKDEIYDETNLSKQYVSFLKGKQVLIEIKKDFDLQKLNMLLDQFDQPYADSSFIPVYYLTKYCREYTKVILGGDGGDELFNGYPFMHYAFLLSKNSVFSSLFDLASILKSFFPDNFKRSFDRLYNVKELQLTEILYNLGSWLPKNTKFNNKNIFCNNSENGYLNYLDCFKNETPQNDSDIIVFDNYRKTLLSDYLRKTDIMSMMNSVEYRVPMLDEDLLQFAFTIPFNQKSSFNKNKIILRNLHYKCYKGIGNNSTKSGFGIPLDIYLTKAEKKEILYNLTKENNYIKEFISKDYIKFISEQFISYNAYRIISRGAIYQRVLLFYSLQRWLERNFP